MKTDKLYFNEQEVDYNRDVSISANYQISTFENLDSFQVSYTNSLDLPKTEKNIQIMRGYGIVGNNSDVAYRINKVTYVRNGFLQFENASAIVREVNNKFRINIYFQNNSLFEAIEGKNLNDLELSQFNHALDFEGYTSRLDGDVVAYALANYGGQTDSNIVFEFQVPSIKISYLWNRIFNEARFSYIYKGRGNRNDFNPFISEEFLNSRITIDNGLEAPSEAPTENVLEAIRSRTEDFSEFVQSFFFGDIWSVPFNIRRDVFFGIEFIQSDSISVVGNVFTINESGYYSINIFGTTVVQAIEQLELIIHKNGLPIAEVESFDVGTTEIGFEERFYFQQGDQINIFYLLTNPEGDQPLGFSYDLNLRIDSDNQFRFINFNEFFNNISQTDFIKTIANKFGLIFVQKGDVYEFITLKELLTPFARYGNFNQFNPRNFVFDDWSGKFNRLIRQTTKLSNQWARRNFLKYQYRNADDNFADALIEINDQTLNAEGVILQSLFNAPETSLLRVANRSLRRMPLYEVEDEGVKPQRSRPFIFNSQSVTGSFNFRQIGGEVVQYNGNFELADFRGLSYNELKNKWLQPLEYILDPTEVYEVELAISEKDVAELEWFKLKYIKQLQGLFYLNRIINFTNDEVTRVELIKVRPQEQLGEFNNDFNEDFNI